MEKEDEILETTEKNEIVITFAKLRDNLLRYWWIIAAGILIAIISIVWIDSKETSGETTVVSAELMFYFEEKEEDTPDGNTEEQLLTEIIKGNTDGLNYLELSEMAVEMMGTQTTIKEINKEMENAGFKDYQFNANQAELTATDRLLVCTIEGSDSNEVVSLSRIYSDILIDNMNMLEKNAALSILQGADEESLIEDSASSDDGGIFSVKNVFILCLALMGALLIIFLLTLKDRYIRSKDEVEQLKEVPVLGELKYRRKAEWKEDFILPEYLQVKGYEHVALVKVNGRKIKAEFIKEISAYCTEEIGKTVTSFCGISGGETVDEKYKEIILLISINDDHIEDVRKVAERLYLLNKDIIGVVYVYS